MRHSNGRRSGAAQPAVPERGRGGRLRRGTPRRRREEAWAWFFLFPTVLGLVVFSIGPAVVTFYYSFTSWGAFGGATFIGLENYGDLLGDQKFRVAMANTLRYALIGLVGIPIAIVVATLINLPGLRGKQVYRTLYFLPVVTLPAAIAMVWRYLYNGDYGLINAVLRPLGISGIYWLSDPTTSLLAIAMVSIWMGLGYDIVMLSAGLTAIPVDYYEAAELDGAGPVRMFLSITLPLLSPTIFLVTVLNVISTVQIFDLIYMMIPENSPTTLATQSVVLLFYRTAFTEANGGYAAAMIVVLFTLILALTVVQMKIQRRWVHYA